MCFTRDVLYLFFCATVSTNSGNKVRMSGLTETHFFHFDIWISVKRTSKAFYNIDFQKMRVF
ncbi:hypothetical protein LEP1GSC194_2622 [Leptospira alstonii serovar Sichuan str. 79601]|uniref:Uncharacterized protein n=1 Tax=Leptospira alstonii serovar Sichuan str. 79601 TaxID=1218565 RepID=M6DA41_9LEPT|nr:hypothetical protein LEP1GSC194_2622 [Leptospira alstonii serovar Sichuan str. 79601]